MVLPDAMTVHRNLGNGFLEAVYQEAFEIELQNQQIPYERENQLPIYYQGTRLKTVYRVDFLCFKSIIVNLKAFHPTFRPPKWPIDNNAVSQQSK